MQLLKAKEDIQNQFWLTQVYVLVLLPVGTLIIIKIKHILM